MTVSKICTKIFMLLFGPWTWLFGMDWNDFAFDTDDSPASVKKYAPVLKFDKDANTYPMNAQEYLDNDCINYVETSMVSHPCSQSVLDTTSNPTYYKVLSDDNEGNMDINYWSFYGRQYACIGDDFNGGPGSHFGDWENIQVHIRENILKSVTYFLHGHHYTAKEWKTEDNHPVVYVGQFSHGSYRSTNPEGPDGQVGGGCGFFWDWRRPESKADWLFTENNLIDVDSSNETWITDNIDVHGSRPLTSINVETEHDGCGRHYEKCEKASNLLYAECLGIKCD